MATVQKPIAVQCFGDKVTNAEWKNLLCWYQISEQDHMIPPETEAFMCDRMNPKGHIRLPASHASMLSHPREIADLILDTCKYV